MPLVASSSIPRPRTHAAEKRVPCATRGSERGVPVRTRVHCAPGSLRKRVAFSLNVVALSIIVGVDNSLMKMTGYATRVADVLPVREL